MTSFCLLESWLIREAGFWILTRRKEGKKAVHSKTQTCSIGDSQHANVQTRVLTLVHPKPRPFQSDAGVDWDWLEWTVLRLLAGWTGRQADGLVVDLCARLGGWLDQKGSWWSGGRVIVLLQIKANVTGREKPFKDMRTVGLFISRPILSQEGHQKSQDLDLRARILMCRIMLFQIISLLRISQRFREPNRTLVSQKQRPVLPFPSLPQNSEGHQKS